MKPRLPSTEFDKIKNSYGAKKLNEGKKAMSENRLEFAIDCFSDTYNMLQEKWWEIGLSDQEIHIWNECSYLAGTCYYELENFSMAYRYLEFSSRYTYLYLTKYIDCLIALRDARILQRIDQHLEFLNDIKEEKRTNDDYELYTFLLNRKAYWLIEIKAYPAAEDTLNYILLSNPKDKFAKEWIEPVKQMRKEQEELQNQNPKENPKENPKPAPPQEEQDDETKIECKRAFKTDDLKQETRIGGIVLILILIIIILHLLK